MFIYHKKRLLCLLALFSISVLAACTEDENASHNNGDNIAFQTRILSDPLALEIYKSPTCGCCNKWIDHLHAQDFNTSVHHPQDLNKEKILRGILPRYQSCHTAESADGFVFEGHVPAKFIKRFLEERPEGAIGLAVPGMPLGSPGMEAGDKFMPYQVLLLKSDGGSEVYASMQTAGDQY